MASSLETLCHDLLRSCVRLLELRNPFNIDHCQLVAYYSSELARHVGFSESDIQRIKYAAEIHTLGVLLQMEEKQPDRDLPMSGLGGRSGREVSIHQREEEIFVHLLTPLPALTGCLEILRQRHEWYDGTGSIAGFSGEEICKEARLMAVVDAYVDLVTPKAHRPPESASTALGRLQELSGLQFDPTYVEALRLFLSREEEAHIANREHRYQVAHCRHYLGLGHFYTQIHETEWAQRSYLAAERMAASIHDRGLELGAISGQFMVFCERRQLERAREVLQQVRRRGTTPRDKLGYQLLWGLLEWLEGSALGKEILTELIGKHKEMGNLPGWVTALAFQTCMTLFTQGAGDSEHLAYLREFMKIIAEHDVFDVVERYRPYTIPVFLNAMVQDFSGNLARNLLTRMGEPCHGPVHQRLKHVHPSQWTKVLMSEPVLGEGETAAGTDLAVEPLYITTLGDLAFSYRDRSTGVQAWPTLKSTKLFLRLAIAGKQPLNAEALAEELWPDSGPKKGRDSLRNSLAQLRRSVRELMGEAAMEVVVRSRKHNTLSLDFPCRFDFQEFEERFARSREAYAANDLRRALQLAEEALAVYRGEFLEGFDEEWALAIRARLLSLRGQALTMLTRCLLALGNTGPAESRARELIALDDLREEAHALLLEALAKGGRSAEAIAHYEHAEALFETEIGIVPERLRERLRELELLL